MSNKHLKEGDELQMNDDKSLSLGKAETIYKQSTHIPSKVQADTLFNFTTELKFLITSIKNSMLSPRYNEENIEYLKIGGIKRIAVPMKCFCDINMHRLEEHLIWYGYYGLAFSKEWGMRNKVQPIQYINQDSFLSHDFSNTFSAALKINHSMQTQEQKLMKSFLLHQLMYYKPYSGNIENRNTKETCEKCFTDECEWRFIPQVSKAGFKQIFYDENIFNAGVLNDLSNSMDGVSEISLNFEYNDIKYVIVKTMSDFKELTEVITSLEIEQEEKYGLISKIIIWENSRGDF